METTQAIIDRNNEEGTCEVDFPYYTKYNEEDTLPYIGVELKKILVENKDYKYIPRYFNAQDNSIEMDLGEETDIDPYDVKVNFDHLLNGIHFLHNDLQIVHKDIKLENIQSFDDGTLKYIDFDLSIPRSYLHPESDEFPFFLRSKAGTRGYVCPVFYFMDLVKELDENYVETMYLEADYWSLGMCLLPKCVDIFTEYELKWVALKKDVSRKYDRKMIIYYDIHRFFKQLTQTLTTSAFFGKANEDTFREHVYDSCFRTIIDMFELCYLKFMQHQIQKKIESITLRNFVNFNTVDVVTVSLLERFDILENSSLIMVTNFTKNFKNSVQKKRTRNSSSR